MDEFARQVIGHPDKDFVLFDVGANNGEEYLDLAQNNPFIKLFLFEPTPNLVKDIKAKTAGMNNVHVIEAAVADYNGVTEFNIAGQGDWGCSSLQNFHKDIDKTWGWRTDFKFTDKIQVQVITLKEYLEAHDINRIDYLHVDTQGSDILVMNGLGEHIHNVQAGQVEVALKVKLYENSTTKPEFTKFLNDNGFGIWHVHQDADGHEANLYFRR